MPKQASAIEAFGALAHVQSGSAVVIGPSGLLGMFIQVSEILTSHSALFYRMNYICGFLSLRLRLLGLAICHRVILVEVQAHTIHAVSLVRRGIVPLPLKNMSQMTTAVAAHDFCPAHSESAICMSCHGSRNAVEISRPSTAGLEFMSGLVKRRRASRTGVDPFIGRMFIELAGKGSFSSLLAEDAKLLCYRQYVRDYVGLGGKSTGMLTFVENSLPFLI